VQTIASWKFKTKKQQFYLLLLEDTIIFDFDCGHGMQFHYQYREYILSSHGVINQKKIIFVAIVF
jgi:hypothetical protein